MKVIASIVVAVALTAAGCGGVSQADMDMAERERCAEHWRDVATGVIPNDSTSPSCDWMDE
jgi:hypothetical protein